MPKYSLLIRFICLLLVAGLSLLPSEAQVLRVAQWNIGHFSCGRADESFVSRSEAAAMGQKYKAFIDSVGADILSLNEFSPAFTRPDESGNTLMAAQTVLADYPSASVGPKWQYNCNALFARKYKWRNPQTKLFDHAVEKRYYQWASIRLGLKRVVIVSAHLDWNSGDSGKVYRQRQIAEIVERFGNLPRVIICGDWNVDEASEFAPFEAAGFTLANKTAAGSLPTWPSGESPNLPIDNIVVKGLRVSNVKVFNDQTLSDHCLIVADVE